MRRPPLAVGASLLAVALSGSAAPARAEKFTLATLSYQPRPDAPPRWDPAG